MSRGPRTGELLGVQRVDAAVPANVANVAHARAAGRPVDVGAAAHGVALCVRSALRGADALEDRALVLTGFGAAVGAARRAQMTAGTRLTGPDLLSVVLAACAAGLVRLELGDATEAGADGRADGGGVDPAVRDFIVALIGVSNAAEAGLVPRGVEQ